MPNMDGTKLTETYDVRMEILIGHTETANVERGHKDGNSGAHSTDRTDVKWTRGSASLSNALNAGAI